MSATLVATAARSAPTPPRHTLLEDAFGLLTGTLLTAFGLTLLHAGGAVTGGTAGLSLLLAYATGFPLTALLVVVGLPFLALGVRRKGWAFTARSVLCIALVAVLSAVLPAAVPLGTVNPVAGALLGNLVSGVGLLILFRHDASAGGFGIVALIAQESLGWRAGFVQLALDACVVLLALAVLSPTGVAISAAGAVVLNSVLALNHRPGRYLGV
ncbi:YitT family protein [Spongisporangium articulatum]|uniref:YitT family protein n=1 Tax=Spongisporangium articulatum TaxID=3362603 RepID=A0ABW8ANK2_9ACTN